MTEQAQEPHMDLLRFVVTQSGQLDVFAHPILKQINPHQRIRLASVIKNVGEDILQRAVADADALAENLEKGDG